MKGKVEFGTLGLVKAKHLKKNFFEYFFSRDLVGHIFYFNYLRFIKFIFSCSIFH